MVRPLSPGAHFATAHAESSFRDRTFDLITAAGSLNYTDPTRAFPELRRVLTPEGTLAVYDFHLPDFPYQRPPDGAIKLSPEILEGMNTGFRLVRSEVLDLPVAMTHDQYVAFLKTEVTVTDPPSREQWNLAFRGYIAWLQP